MVDSDTRHGPARRQVLADPDVTAVMQQGWQRLHPDFDVAPISVTQRMLRGARIILERSDAHLATFGLTRGELDILSALRRANGPLGPTELTDLLLASPPAVTKRLQALKSRRLIARHADSGDRRRSAVSITPAGTLLVDQVVPAQLAIEAELLAGLADDQRQQLAGLLHQLVGGWEQQRYHRDRDDRGVWPPAIAP